MNLASPSFDLPEVEVEEAPCTEAIDETVLPTLRQPAEFGNTLHAYRAHAMTLVPTDATSLAQCAAFVLTCKAAEKYAESKRKSLVDPLNKMVRDHNETWMPIAKGFEQVWRDVDGRLSRYIYAEQQKAILEQQRELARAAQERALLEAQAAKARAVASAAAQLGSVQEAAKAEAKADRLELKAETVIAEVVPVQAKTLDMGGATLTAKAPKDDWCLPGWDREMKLYADSPLLDGVDMAWLRRFCVVDPVRLNAAFKGGEQFPKPFGKTVKFSGSILRGGK